MIELQNRKGLAKYLQVRDIIHGRIQSREYAPGSLIPPESELMNMFGVAKMTVRQALSELEREGLLRREQGRGTFVEAPAEPHPRILIVESHRSLKIRNTDPESSFFHLTASVLEEGSSHDFEVSSISLALYESDKRFQDDRNYIFPWPPDDLYGMLREMADAWKNVIVINRVINYPNIACFSTDHYHAARTGIERMIARGHRKIGFVIFQSQDIGLREQGYRDAMTEAGLEIEPDFICRWDRDKDNTQFEPMLKSGVTAVMMAQGFLLRYFMRGLGERNIRVPDDLEVITFNRISDQLPYKHCVHEIVEPFREMARLAVSRIMGEEEMREVNCRLLEPDFVMKKF